MEGGLVGWSRACRVEQGLWGGAGLVGWSVGLRDGAWTFGVECGLVGWSVGLWVEPMVLDLT